MRTPYTVRMEFGRMKDVSGVDFRLPDDAQANRRVLAQSVTTGPAQFLLGLPGWSDRGFVGSLYPQRTQSRDFLRHYARVFPTNELNSTF